MRGYAPVAEIQFDGFIFPAFDQITTQVARLHLRSAGTLSMRIVIRVPNGGGIGAVEHHSESPEAYFAHTPGLRIVTPSTPADAFMMIRQAIAHPDPVLFFEPKRRYWDKGEVDVDAPAGARCPSCSRRGSSSAATTRPCCAGGRWCARAWTPPRPTPTATSRSSTRAAWRRWTWPTIVESVGRTGRLIVVHEAPVVGGVGAEIAAEVTQECFYQLEAPVLRVGGFHAPYPPSRIEDIYLPDLDRILEAVDRSMAY